MSEEREENENISRKVTNFSIKKKKSKKKQIGCFLERALNWLAHSKLNVFETL